VVNVLARLVRVVMDSVAAAVARVTRVQVATDNAAALMLLVKIVVMVKTAHRVRVKGLRMQVNVVLRVTVNLPVSNN